MKSIICGVMIGSLSFLGSADAFAAQRMGTSAATAHSSATAGTVNKAQPTTLGPSHPTGQPNQSCGSVTAPETPGNAASAPGSAFNPMGHAGTVYAGQQQQNSRNSASVSQYDVACSHQR